MTISSPCIKQCIIDPPSQLCRGCGRALDEIARWGQMSEKERLAIMAGLSARKKARFADKARDMSGT